MTTLDIRDPVTGGMHNARLKPAKAAPIPEAPQETYEQMRERFLLRWCREKNSQGWCGTFDNIMVADLGYTAKAVLEARARFDYQHAATVTFTVPHEITKTGEKATLDYVRRYIRDYFAIENTAGCTATMEMISTPEPEPTGLTELQVEKARVLKTIIGNASLGSLTQTRILDSLGYTSAEVTAAKMAGRWTYTISLNWHCSSRISYPADIRNAIRDRVAASARSYFVTDATITPGTTIELN